MTQEKINEKYVILESREDLLKTEAKELEEELQDLNNLENVSKLKKAELKREVEIRRRLSEIDEELNNIQYEYDSLDGQAQELENEEHLKKTSKRGKVFAGIAIVLAMGAAFAVGRCNKDTKCSSKNANPDKSISMTTDTPVVTPEPTMAPVLVDVTNDEDVKNASTRILEENVNAIIGAENDPVYTDLATAENIEDIIRVVNAELPKYSEYDDFTIGETVNKMSDIFVNRGLGNTLYPVELSKLYPDGSKEAEYVATYDVIYNNIAKYRAEGNVDGVIEQVGVLGSKLYNEWHEAGLYGGYNPFLFPEEEQYFLLQCATSRFPNYVREYLEANDLTVCIPTCYNPETQEYKLVEVRDVFEALYMGTSKNGEISVLRSGEVINLFGETYQDLKYALDLKAQENVKVLK